MEYTIRFTFERDGAMIAPLRMTYSSHEVPTATRDVRRDAVDAALKRLHPSTIRRRDGRKGCWAADRHAICGRPHHRQQAEESTTM